MTVSRAPTTAEIGSALESCYMAQTGASAVCDKFKNPWQVDACESRVRSCASSAMDKAREAIGKGYTATNLRSDTKVTLQRIADCGSKARAAVTDATRRAETLVAQRRDRAVQIEATEILDTKGF